MKVAAHQPHFLPWLGYLNKVAAADTFVWLDTVSYRKNYFQNRCRIHPLKDDEQWLTVPVHAHLDTPITQVEVAGSRWRKKMVATLEQGYAKAPFYEDYWPSYREILLGDDRRLSELNWRLFRQLMVDCELEGIQVVRAGELSASSDDPNQRLIELCLELGGDTYIAGRGGRDYMDVDAFGDAGIDVVWQDFDPRSASYPHGSGTTVHGLSALDALFHLGGAETGALARRAWAPPVEA